jgi:hypothetical protein
MTVPPLKRILVAACSAIVLIATLAAPAGAAATASGASPQPIFSASSTMIPSGPRM